MYKITRNSRYFRFYPSNTIKKWYPSTIISLFSLNISPSKRIRSWGLSRKLARYLISIINLGVIIADS